MRGNYCPLHSSVRSSRLQMFFKMVYGQLPPRKIVPRLELGFWLGLGLVLGLGDNFPRGQLSLEPFKIGLLKNFAKFTGKHARVSFFIKLQA